MVGKGSWGNLWRALDSIRACTLFWGPREFLLWCGCFLTILIVYNLVALSALIMLCNHHHYFQHLSSSQTEKPYTPISPGEFLKGLKLKSDNDIIRAEIVMTPIRLRWAKLATT